MKCQSMFLGKINKKKISLLSAEFTQRVVKVNSFPASGLWSSADNICKQFGPGSGLIKGPDLDPNCLTL